MSGTAAQRLGQLAGPAAAAAALHAALLVAYVAAFRGDVSALACVARERLGRPPYEHVRTGFDRNGYDGQFYYALARAPWRRHGEDIDTPAVRQARLLYPALSWLLSGGDASRLLWIMPLINLLAVAGLAAVGAAAARDGGLGPWWGVLLPLAVNAGMPALRNLTDVTSTLAVAALLLAWLRRGPWWAGALAAAAALFSREQNLAVVLLLLAFVARQEAADRRWLAGLLAALLGWAAWIVGLRLLYGRWALLPAGNLGPPLAGLISRGTHLTGESPGVTAFHVVGLSSLALQLVLAAWLWRLPGDRVVRLVALSGAALAVLGGPYLYGDSWSYPRVFAWLPLGVWLACAERRQRWPLAALSVPGVLLPLAVVFRVWGERGA